ncbi:MAG: lasso peptide biosynthesis B2 protein [Terracidiphilus sp.]|jgi:hypothetical protein
MTKNGKNAAYGSNRRRRPSLGWRLFARRKDLLLAVNAMGWLLLAWLAIDLLPFKLYRNMMRHVARKPEMGLAPAAEFTKRVAWAVRAAARRVPWRAVCFHQGIAAQQMLCRAGVPAELHYGVAKTANGVAKMANRGFEAHVWVTSYGKMVVGGETRDRFTVLGIFAGGDAPVPGATLNARETLPPH